MDIKEYYAFCEPVLAPPGCSNIYPPPTPTPTPTPTRSCQLVKNEICGNIEQFCNGEWEEYWRNFGVDATFTGSLVVYNGSGCPMSVRGVINGAYVFLFSVMNQGQSKSITVSGIENLEIQCLGSDPASRCSGRYCLTVHYPLACEIPGE
ncbi:hypothetical protein LCL96_16745 [Rossellomorea aquimaris]|uniref:S-Ena type endospore appendage n=1 Tax=Rossellomorea aquimaris TaxID=189382 RepID=UPI001CD5BB7C|nr:S-Ena type endospore appendage [Rossellomorea aquimaris]MCA1060586.1 hypothetical protein [Rossellomorea aquimaris]